MHSAGCGREFFVKGPGSLSAAAPVRPAEPTSVPGSAARPCGVAARAWAPGARPTLPIARALGRCSPRRPPVPRALRRRWRVRGLVKTDRSEAAHGDLRDGDRQQFLDVAQQGCVFGRHQRHGTAVTTGPSGAAHPMDVVLGHERQIRSLRRGAAARCRGPAPRCRWPPTRSRRPALNVLSARVRAPWLLLP